MDRLTQWHTGRWWTGMEQYDLATNFQQMLADGWHANKECKENSNTIAYGPIQILQDTAHMLDCNGEMPQAILRKHKKRENKAACMGAKKGRWQHEARQNIRERTWKTNKQVENLEGLAGIDEAIKYEATTTLLRATKPKKKTSLGKAEKTTMAMKASTTATMNVQIFC